MKTEIKVAGAGTEGAAAPPQATGCSCTAKKVYKTERIADFSGGSN